MKKYISKDRLLNVYFLFFALCLVFKFINSILYNAYYYWDVSEWLINYQGGFVRRGLKGEFLFLLHKHFSLDPCFVMGLIALLAFIVLSFIIVKGFIKKGYSLFILPCIFFLGSPILHNTWLKVDNLMLLVFVSIVYLVVQKPRFYLIWVNLLFIFGLLNHESFIFYSFPIVLLLISYNLYGDRKSCKPYVSSLLWLIPSILACIAVFYFKGSNDIASSIWNSWNDVSFSHISPRFDSDKPPFGIAALGFTLKDGLYWYTGKFIRVFDYGLYGPIMILVSIVIVYFILTNINKLNNPILKQKPINQNNKSTISAVLFFQFCCIFPLFILGCDYSRWISFWVISSFSIILFVPDKVVMQVLPNIVINLSAKCDGFLFGLFGDSKSLILVLTLIFGLPVVGWSLLGYVQTSSIYVVMSTISSFFEYILKTMHIACYQQFDFPLFD